MKYLKIWRDAATSKRVGMPRFLDVDWRVDVKASSASLAQMSKPTLLLDLKVKQNLTCCCEAVSDCWYERFKTKLHPPLSCRA